MKLSDAVTKGLERKGMSLNMLGRKVELTATTIDRIKKGHVLTSIEHMERIARALDIDPADIEEYRLKLVISCVSEDPRIRDRVFSLCQGSKKKARPRPKAV